MKHKTLAAWMAVMIVCGIGIPAAGAEEVIVSWESPGQVAFNEIPDAAGYRIEWASTLDGPWHKFSLRTAHGLNFIPANGFGTRTVAVPMFFRVVATVPDRERALPMVPVPGGTFTRGDLHDGVLSSIPTHEVTLDAFEIATTPVTVGQWMATHAWALANGYEIEQIHETGSASDQPVSSVSWYDAVKWCNARSEMEYLTPCYTVNGEIYRQGRNDDVVCDWTANGYRLPTEAEWERAARGGTTTRFPWGDRISHSNANYNAFCQDGEFLFPYDDGPTCGVHPDFANVWPPTAPVHHFAPNPYGLYEVIGNVLEWCWDWYAPYQADPQTNPRGPDTPHVVPLRVIRSGPYTPVVVAARWPLPPDIPLTGTQGFRPARRPPAP